MISARLRQHRPIPPPAKLETIAVDVLIGPPETRIETAGLDVLIAPPVITEVETVAVDVLVTT